MTVFLVIALVVLTLISLGLAVSAGYGQALKDQAKKSEKSKENIKAFLDLLKSFIEYVSSEDVPEKPKEQEPEKENKPEQAE